MGNLKENFPKFFFQTDKNKSVYWWNEENRCIKLNEQRMEQSHEIKV